MDWWRAKLILVGAFLCLDILLVLQIRGMRLPVVPAPVRQVLHLQSAQPAPLPPLQVETVGWLVGDESLLPGSPQCDAPFEDQSGTILSERCTAPGSGAELDLVGGVLQYTGSSQVPAARAGEAKASAQAAALIARLDPEVPAGALTGGRLEAATGLRTFAATESWLGTPLFDGRWTVSLGPRLVQAEGSRLQVLGAFASPLPLISAAVAAVDAARLYGKAAIDAAGIPPLLGYYAPPWPPAQPWLLWPVYLVHVGASDCVYLSAVAGGATAAEAVAAVQATAASDFGQRAGVAAPLSPQPC